MGDAATLRSDWQPPLLAPPLPGMGQVIAWTTYSKVVYALRREAAGLKVIEAPAAFPQSLSPWRASYLRPGFAFGGACLPKDLRALLKDLSERGKEITTEYGNVAAPTIGAIQRRLVVLEEQGGNQFFGEPALEIDLGLFNLELLSDRFKFGEVFYPTFILRIITALKLGEIARLF